LAGQIVKPEDTRRLLMNVKIDVMWWDDQEKPRLAWVSDGTRSMNCTQGATVDAKLTAHNRLYSSEQVEASFRVQATPSAVQNLLSDEIFEKKLIEVQFERPSDTGFGDGDDTADILMYKVEWSLCGDFRQSAACLPMTRELVGVNASIVMLNLTQQDLKQGEKYFIRVSAANAIGFGKPVTVEQRYQIKPQMLLPADKLVKIASSGDYSHIWLSGADPQLNGNLEVKISGLGIETKDLLVASLSLEGSSIHLSVGNFVKSSAKNEISFTVMMPNRSCTSVGCFGSILFSSRKQPAYTAALLVHYFSYPGPEFLSLLPAGGPQGGGTPVVLQVRDFVGTMTRYYLRSFDQTPPTDHLLALIYNVFACVRAPSNHAGMEDFCPIFSEHSRKVGRSPWPCSAEKMARQLRAIRQPQRRSVSWQIVSAPQGLCLHVLYS